MSKYIDFRYGLLLIIMIGITSCKSKKEILIPSEKKTISDILNSSHDYKRYEAKAKIKFSSSQESFKGILNLRIQGDSAILMAIKKIGVEGARTLITQDSVTHIDRINHNYYIQDISKLKAQDIQLTYEYSELLLSGSPPSLTKENIIDSTYTKENIKIKTMINDMMHVLTYDIYTGLLAKVEFVDMFSMSGSWTYSDYRLVGDKAYFPYHRSYEITSENLEKIILELDFSNIEINVSKSISINIPDSYNRIY